MPAVAADPAKARARALQLLNLAVGNGNKNEKRNACLKLGEHLVKHPYLLDEQAAPAPKMNVAETVAKVREVAADPTVRETADSIAKAAGAVSEMFGKLGDAIGKRKR